MKEITEPVIRIHNLNNANTLRDLLVFFFFVVLMLADLAVASN